MFENGWVYPLFGCIAYMVFSICTNVLQPAILNSVDNAENNTAFTMPILVVSIGNVLTGLLFGLAYLFGYIKFSRALKEILTFKFFMKNIFGIGFMLSISSALTGFGSEGVSAAMQGIIKGMAPGISYALMLLAGIDQFSWLEFLAIVVVTFGALGGSFVGDTSFYMTAIMAGAVLSECFRNVGTQKLCHKTNITDMEYMVLVYCVSAVCSFIFWLTLEAKKISDPQTITSFNYHKYSILFVAVIYVILNFLNMYIIRTANMVLFKLLSSFRTIIVVALGMLTGGQVPSMWALIGYFCNLTGFFLYLYLKSRRVEPEEIPESLEEFHPTVRRLTLMLEEPSFADDSRASLRKSSCRSSCVPGEPEDPARLTTTELNLAADLVKNRLDLFAELIKAPKKNNKTL